MENRQFITDLSLMRGTSQLTPPTLNVGKRKYVFSLLRLQPLTSETSTMQLTTPLFLPSSVPRPPSQFVRINNTHGIAQQPVVYPMQLRKASPSVSERAVYTYIPAANKSKEIGATDALLGCSMLLLLAVLVLAVLYYLAS